MQQRCFVGMPYFGDEAAVVEVHRSRCPHGQQASRGRVIQYGTLRMLAVTNCQGIRSHKQANKKPRGGERLKPASPPTSHPALRNATWQLAKLFSCWSSCRIVVFSAHAFLTSLPPNPAPHPTPFNRAETHPSEPKPVTCHQDENLETMGRSSSSSGNNAGGCHRTSSSPRCGPAQRRGIRLARPLFRVPLHLCCFCSGSDGGSKTPPRLAVHYGSGGYFRRKSDGSSDFDYRGTALWWRPKKLKETLHSNRNRRFRRRRRCLSRHRRHPN